MAHLITLDVMVSCFRVYVSLVFSQKAKKKTTISWIFSLKLVLLLNENNKKRHRCSHVISTMKMKIFFILSEGNIPMKWRIKMKKRNNIAKTEYMAKVDGGMVTQRAKLEKKQYFFYILYGSREKKRKKMQN